MQALIYTEPGQLCFREVAEPVLSSPSAALVRPIVVTSCDLDGAIVRGLTAFEPPFALGHEFVAEVTQVGEDATVRPGDIVAVAYQPSCGICRMCKRGLTNACREVPKASMYGVGPRGGDWGGALSDRVLVPYANAMLVPLPDGISARQAASASDNLADAYRCVAPQLTQLPGAPVLIAGGGGIALYAADIARRLGSERVSLYAQQRALLERAQALGIDVFSVERWPERFPTHPITVDCTNDPAGLRALIASTEAGGTCTSASMFPGDVPLPLRTMYMKGITFHTSRTHGAAVLPQMLREIARGVIDPLATAPLIASWRDAPEALLSGALKVVIDRRA
jgi:threonine dehydrogenase-like Zn-dependent dehydrogenase